MQKYVNQSRLKFYFLKYPGQESTTVVCSDNQITKLMNYVLYLFIEN